MRTQPIAFFLVDVAFPANAKFRALARRLQSDDDFNSAVGAFFIALAAARRNGKPDIDARDETGSRFIADLVAVGLLCETGFNGGPFRSWSAMAPQQAAGMARAASAVRTAAGTYASALAPLVALDSAGQAGPALPSPPLPSVQPPLESSLSARAREDDPVADALFGAYGGNPSANVLSWGDRLAEKYGAKETADAIGTALLNGREGIMGRAEGALKLAARHAEHVEQEDERSRLQEKRRPVLLKDAVVTPDPERVGAIMGNIAATIGYHAGGTAVPKPGGKP